MARHTYKLSTPLALYSVTVEESPPGSVTLTLHGTDKSPSPFSKPQWADFGALLRWFERIIADIPETVIRLKIVDPDKILPEGKAPDA